MTDKEILDMVIGGMRVADMSAITFLNMMADHLNGVDAYKAANQELLGLVSNPPMTRTIADPEKCRIVRKLLELGVKL